MSKAKKKGCPSVASNVCSANLVAATMGLEKSCEGKQAILPRLMIELRKNVRAGRMTAAHADSIFKGRMKGAELTCRTQGARMKKQEELAREATRKLEADRERIVGGQAMDGLLGLGLFGIL